MKHKSPVPAGRSAGLSLPVHALLWLGFVGFGVTMMSGCIPQARKAPGAAVQPGDRDLGEGAGDEDLGQDPGVEKKEDASAAPAEDKTAGKQVEAKPGKAVDPMGKDQDKDQAISSQSKNKTAAAADKAAE